VWGDFLSTPDIDINSTVWDWWPGEFLTAAFPGPVSFAANLESHSQLRKKKKLRSPPNISCAAQPQP